MERGPRFGWVFTGSLLAVLFGAAGYLALEARPIEYDPNRLSAGNPNVLPLVLLAMLVCGLVYAAAAVTRETSNAMAIPLLPLVGLAAVLLAAARYHSYDDYALPTLQRISDVTDVPAWSLTALVASAAAAGLVSLVKPRVGLVLEGLVLWIAAIWMFILGPFN